MQSRRFRWFWFALGLCCLGLAGLGLILPAMPGVVFALIAAWAFSRGSPTFEARLRAHPHFGPHVRAWRDHGAIGRRGKIMAVLGMAFGMTIAAFTGLGQTTLIIIGAFIALSAAFVVTRPAPPLDEAG